MKFCLIVCLIFSFGVNCVFGKISHLMVTSIGDGVVQVGKNSSAGSIATAKFLPKSVKLSVRPKSGIETLASGYQFRFGASTTFICENESIEIFSGSLFIRSRNFNSFLEIIGPETSVQISGAGTCLLDVEPNGGFKIVGLLGKMRISNPTESSISLHPGELTFTDLKNSSFSEKIIVDLVNLLDTSILISGFLNSSSFEKSLKSIAESQKVLIGKSYQAKVGNAADNNKFEIVKTVTSENEAPAETDMLASELIKNYQPSSDSPLQELLGRSPLRSVTQVGTNMNMATNIPDEVKDKPGRPFPSRVLRGE